MMRAGRRFLPHLIRLLLVRICGSTGSGSIRGKAVIGGVLLMWAAAAASAAGTGLQMYGQHRQGQYAAAMGKYNQQVAEIEAQNLEQEGVAELAAASHNTDRIREQARTFLGEVRARSAAGGADSQDATSVAVRQEAVKRASLDQLIEMAKGEQAKQDLEYSATVRRHGGKLERFKGQQQRIASNIGMASTILTQAGGWAQTFGGMGGGGGAAAGNSGSGSFG